MVCCSVFCPALVIHSFVLAGLCIDYLFAVLIVLKLKVFL